jgi:hypothetical protein
VEQHGRGGLADGDDDERPHRLDAELESEPERATGRVARDVVEQHRRDAGGRDDRHHAKTHT